MKGDLERTRMLFEFSFLQASGMVKKIRFTTDYGIERSARVFTSVQWLQYSDTTVSFSAFCLLIDVRQTNSNTLWKTTIKYSDSAHSKNR